MILILLNLWRVILWLMIWFILVNVRARVCVCVCELCILLLESECFIYTYELGTVIVRLSISFQVEYCSLQL